MNKDLYKLYQLISFFVMKFSYKTLQVPNMKSDEIWLINPNHQFYPFIRVTTNSIEQVMFEEERLRETIDFVAKRLRLSKSRLLDVHVGRDDILDEEKFDSIAIDIDYYDGIELKDIYPGIHSVIHYSDNPNLEIKEIITEINDYTIHAKKQKRALRATNQPIVTMACMLICIFMYFLTFFLTKKLGGDSSANINALVVLGANYKMFTVGVGEFFRVLTSGFLHGSIFHLLVNMIALYNLGQVMETQMGSKRYALTLFLSIIIGSLCSLVFSANGISVGISGGLYGLLGLLIANAIREGNLNDPQLVRVIILNLMINFMGGIDFMAHIGGFVCGFILFYAFNQSKTFYAALALVLVMLSYKVFTIKEIEPKFGGTDFKIVEIYNDLGFEGHATKLNAKLNDVYEHR